MDWQTLTAISDDASQRADAAMVAIDAFVSSMIPAETGASWIREDEIPVRSGTLFIQCGLIAQDDGPLAERPAGTCEDARLAMIEALRLVYLDPIEGEYGFCHDVGGAERAYLHAKWHLKRGL